MAKPPDQNGVQKDNSPGEDSVEMEIELRGIGAGQFANHMVVQADPDTVRLMFFQVIPPLFIGMDTAEEKRAEMKRLGKVHADCVSSVIVPREKIDALVGALVNTLSKGKSRGTQDSVGKSGE